MKDDNTIVERRNFARVAFIANMETTREYLEKGHSIRYVYEILNKDNLFPYGYSSFCKLSAKYNLTNNPTRANKKNKLCDNYNKEFREIQGQNNKIQKEGKKVIEIIAEDTPFGVSDKSISDLI